MFLGVDFVGGLGNRLFQYASSYGVLRRLGLGPESHVLGRNPDSNCNGVRSLDFSFLFGLFSRVGRGSVVCSVRERSSMSGFDDSDYVVGVSRGHLGCSGTVMLSGFFQHEGYFRAYSGEVRSRLLGVLSGLGFSSEGYGVCWERSYFLHVRLGDYVNNAETRRHFFVDLSLYFERAISHLESLDPGASLVIFAESESDLRSLYPGILTDSRGLPRRVIVADFLLTFYLMTLCGRGGICSNSTFSWWGAWLNPNASKTVCIPDRWRPMGKASPLEMDGAIIIPTN